MPRGFTDEEKAVIKQRLIHEGRRLFSTHGFRKATVKDVTRAVGISQGAFYGFFESKEELFFDILDVESQEMRQALCEDVRAVTEDQASQGIKDLIMHALQLTDGNHLFQDLLSDQATYEALVRHLPERKLQAHIAMDLKTLGPVITDWQDRDILRPVQPELIAGVLFSLFFLSLHRKELDLVGNGAFEFLVDLIVEGVVNGDARDR